MGLFKQRLYEVSRDVKIFSDSYMLNFSNKPSVSSLG